MAPPLATRPYIPVASVGRSFDPLNLQSDAKLAPLLVPLREAELKHSRLAMIAAVGWPLQEIWHPSLVNLLQSLDPAAANLLVDGCSPSLINGGLFQPGIAPALAVGVFLGTVLELHDMKQKQLGALNNVLGSLAVGYQEAQGVDDVFYEPRPQQPGHISSFDPLRVYRSMSTAEKRQLMEKELLNGRVAMVAVSCYAAEEGLYHAPLIAPF